MRKFQAVLGLPEFLFKGGRRERGLTPSSKEYIFLNEWKCSACLIKFQIGISSSHTFIKAPRSCFNWKIKELDTVMNGFSLHEGNRKYLLTYKTELFLSQIKIYFFDPACFGKAIHSTSIRNQNMQSTCENTTTNLIGQNYQ